MQRFDAYDVDLDFDALAAEYGVSDEPVAPLYPQASSSRAAAWAEPSAERIPVRAPEYDSGAQYAHRAEVVEQAVAPRRPYAAPARPTFAAAPALEPRGGRDSRFTAQRQSANPISHGVELKPVTLLPDQYRSMFRFQHFNAVQSSVLDDVLHSDVNVVLAAPTGSGKTGAFELAIIRMLHTQDASAKAVYLAPTKALCTERASDWKARLDHLGCRVAELTGDTNASAGLEQAKRAGVIVATPEKWDSVTRRWRDNEAMLKSVKLLLVDEIHTLRERGRGACIECVVSRMRTYGSNVRVVVLSATVPNAQDIATWLGSGTQPAKLHKFGEEFRPCPLTRHVYAYPNPKGDQWSFMHALNSKLVGIMQQHAESKPTLIFVPTRKAASQAALAILKDYKAAYTRSEAPPWRRPHLDEPLVYKDKALTELAPFGIAFHHAGLDLTDRRAVEANFLKGRINALCSTSSLAVGVNLPAYLVIIRGTQSFDGAWREMNEIDLLQAVGRAGRPQFDTSGCCVILTEQQHKDRWQRLLAGSTPIESTLHLDLVEHINAEIGLRGKTDEAALRRFLATTFLFVRLRQNPAHYDSLLQQGSGPRETAPDVVMDRLLQETLVKLGAHDLIDARPQAASPVCSNERGHILSQYFLSLKTMGLLCDLKANSSVKDVLEALCNAEEYSEIRIRQGEKVPLNSLRTHPDIRYPPAKVVGGPEKRSLLIQATLAGLPLAELLATEGGAAFSPMSECFVLFRHAARITKAAFDLANLKRDGGTARSAFELLRSVSGKAWDGSCATLRQLEGIGDKSIRALAQAGLSTLEAIACTEPHRIEMILGRRAPFGQQIVNEARAMPAFSLGIAESATEVTDEGVALRARVTVGLLRPGVRTRSKSGAQLWVSCLSLTSTSEFLDFRRMPIKKLSDERNFSVRCMLRRPHESLVVIVGCDEIAGSGVRADLHPASVCAADFPVPQLGSAEEMAQQELEGLTAADFDTAELDSLAGQSAPPDSVEPAPRPAKKAKGTNAASASTKASKPAAPPQSAPERLPNGRYKCRHLCKKKCTHKCCLEGLLKPPPLARKASSKKLNTLEQSLLDKISSIGEASATGEAAHNDDPAEAPAPRARSPGLILPSRWVEERAAAAAAAASSAGTAAKRKSSQAPEAVPSAKRPPRQWAGLDPALAEHLANDSATEDSPSPPSLGDLGFFGSARTAPHDHLRDLQPDYDDFEPYAFDVAKAATAAASGAGAAADDPLFFLTSGSSSGSSFSKWRAPAARAPVDHSPAASPQSAPSRAQSPEEVASRSASPEQPPPVERVASPICSPVAAAHEQPAPAQTAMRHTEGARVHLTLPAAATPPSAPQPDPPAAADNMAAETASDDDDMEAWFEEHTL